MIWRKYIINMRNREQVAEVDGIICIEYQFVSQKTMQVAWIKRATSLEVKEERHAKCIIKQSHIQRWKPRQEKHWESIHVLLIRLVWKVGSWQDDFEAQHCRSTKGLLNNFFSRTVVIQENATGCLGILQATVRSNVSVVGKVSKRPILHNQRLFSDSPKHDCHNQVDDKYISHYGFNKDGICSWFVSCGPKEASPNLPRRWRCFSQQFRDGGW